MQSVINRSAVKAYALKVSKEKRAGKFQRVGEDFLTNIEAEVESAIRSVATSYGLAAEDMVKPDSDREFITGAAMEKIRQRLNERARAIVHGKVRRHPSIGRTLKD